MRKLTLKPADLCTRTARRTGTQRTTRGASLPTELGHSVLVLDLNFFYLHIRRAQTHTKELGSFSSFDLEGMQKTS
jgi:hypothetical protein